MFFLTALKPIFCAYDTAVFKCTARILIQQDKIDNFYNDIIITASIKEMNIITVFLWTNIIFNLNPTVVRHIVSQSNLWYYL